MPAGSYDYFATQAIDIQSMFYYRPWFNILYVIYNNEIPAYMAIEETNKQTYIGPIVCEKHTYASISGNKRLSLLEKLTLV